MTLPSGWTREPLGDLLETLIDYRGKTPAKLGGDWAPDGVPVVSAMHVKHGRIDLTRNARFVDPALAQTWMKTPLRAGDLLLTSEAPLGQVAIVPDDRPLVLSQRLFALRAAHGRLDPRFLAHWFRSPDGVDQLQARSSGTTVTGIRQAELVQLQVPLPPLDEQQRILDHLEDHLSRLDAATAGTQQAHRRLDSLEQSVLSECYEKGELLALRSVAAIQGGIQKQPKRAPAGHAFPFLRVANVTARGLDLEDVH